MNTKDLGGGFRLHADYDCGRDEHFFRLDYDDGGKPMSLGASSVSLDNTGRFMYELFKHLSTNN